MGAWRGWFLGLTVMMVTAGAMNAAAAATGAAAAASAATIHELSKEPAIDLKPHRRLAIYRHSRVRQASSNPNILEVNKEQDTVVDLVKHYTNSTTHITNSTHTPDGRRIANTHRNTVKQGSTQKEHCCEANTSSSKVSKRSLTDQCEAGPPPTTAPESGTGDDRVIDVAVLVPCNASHQYSRVKVLPVVELAVRHLRETGLRGPLENYTIIVRYRDSRTSSTYGPLAAVDLYFNKYADVFLGPVDDYVLAPVARFSGAWNVPLLTPGGQPSAFDSRKDYPLLTRLKGFYTEVGKLFSSVVKHWGWNVLGLIYEDRDDEKGNSVCHFTLASIYNSFHTKPHTEKFNKNTNRNFTQLLMNFHDKARSEC
ncbi:hypothetical protein OTU49_002559 [Cherax quadricarinatus]|uniref:Receptor ligand binding region domain-containing protein n=1 Tax=Cherax quadricarinatus TaxID=27406 RepID=A0AAW0XNB2_CHEQU|nr:atrial natriuretic peptide receptor 3-like [Cherax quadricarinatus]